METTFRGCTGNGEREAVISDYSEVRTGGMSRLFVGLVGTARGDHHPVLFLGPWLLNFRSSQWRCCTQKHVCGVVLTTRGRNRTSQPALCGFLCDGPARRIWSAGSEIETLENHFVNNHFLISISNILKEYNTHTDSTQKYHTGINTEEFAHRKFAHKN